MKSELLTKFVEYNRQHRMAGERKRTLLAVSGGVDSQVMCELFRLAGFPFAVAHCNFKLRGKESDADEQLVKETAARMGVPFFSKQFNTTSYAAEKKLSTQMAAREMRYEWFAALAAAEKFDLIATAHHAGDLVETVLLNMTRGTGLRGLRGIPLRNGRVVRPLLFAAKESLLQFAADNNIAYREDESNSEDKYQRNKIRHAVVPVLKELNPALDKALQLLVMHSDRALVLYEKELGRLQKRLLQKQDHRLLIPIHAIRNNSASADVLFHTLHPFGFNETQVHEIMAAVDAIPGTQFISATHRITRDRRVFILTEKKDATQEQHLIADDCRELHFAGGMLRFEKITAPDKFHADKNCCWLNLQQLQFPLLLRKWKQGDYFYPFGMKQKKKKLSKFFKDEKLSLADKEVVWVLESRQRIVWVVGFRSDERFKVSAGQTVLKATFHP